MASRKLTQVLLASLLEMDSLVKAGATVQAEPAHEGAWVRVTVTETGRKPRVGLGPDLLSAFTTAVSPD